MLKVDKTDLVSGLVVLVISAYFAYGAMDYRIGTMARMGPGYVPFALGLMGMALGAVIVLTSFGRAGALEGFRWRVVLPVAASIAAFLLLLPRVGLLPATFVSVIAASMASPKSRVVPTLVLGAVVAVLIWISFVVLLGLPIPVLRSPF
jgi:hypothetical protein